MFQELVLHQQVYNDVSTIILWGALQHFHIAPHKDSSFLRQTKHFSKNIKLGFSDMITIQNDKSKVHLKAFSKPLKSVLGNGQ